LTREAGAWRLASVDLGDDMRYPRVDGPNFVTAFSALIVKVLEDQQMRSRAGQVRAQLRTLIAAPQTYAKFNAGLFAPLECLEQPRACAPAMPAEPFLASPIAVKGYTGAFHAGPPASAADLRRAPGVRRAVKAWAYVMTPQSSGSEERTSCADSTRVSACCRQARPRGSSAGNARLCVRM
jgi:hypothetical protein